MMKAALPFLTLLGSAAAETVTLTPSQDSDVYAFFDAPSFTPDSLNVGADPNQAHGHRSLIQFNIASLTIPAAEIGTAKIRLFSMIPNSTNGGGYRPGNVSIHRQGTAWNLNTTLRWNNIQPQELAGTLVMTATTKDAWVEADITELVKQWASGAKPNYGVALKPESESAEPWLNVEFASMELTNFKPQLVVTRAEPLAVPPVLSLTQQDAQVALEWPVSGSSGWVLQEALSPAGPWVASGASATSASGLWRVTQPVSGGSKYYRLSK
ncbi:DNRLRE domain-containing protein [Haloferula sp. BvORR071]|uniref:DNRLRE domain-containing protein n=1 Tax=Haloferula sp. BvORR071 TaxID=1396141 RepID=UPI0005510BF7|nr:DNRLRE domain-containing protein [Haloferula sp. BvORR071]